MKRYLLFICNVLFITLQCFAQMIFPSGITEIDEYQFENKSISGELIIPDTVVFIGESAFAGNKINSVRLPKSLSNISKLAFAYNKITELVLPNDLVSIGRFAFYSNELTEVDFPQGLFYIRDSAFARNNISVINFPEKLKVIERSTFDSNNITSIYFPQSLEEIGDYAFYNNNIEDVAIPSSVKTLGYSAFYNNKISNLLIERGIKEIQTLCFAKNNISNLVIPSSVNIIGIHAFQNNKITSINIQGICYVGFGAFDGNRITSINIGASISYLNESEADENGKKYNTFGDYSNSFDAFYKQNNEKAGLYTYNVVDGWSFQYNNLKLPFSERIKTNIWNIVGLTVGMIGIIIGVIALVNRREKKPVYSKSDEYDIVDRIKDDNNLKLLWDDIMINNVRVVKISFWNRGKKIIRRDDISDTEPIEIYCVNQDIEILKYFISDISRKEILLSIINKDNCLDVSIVNNEAFEYKDGFEITIYYTRDINISDDDWKIKGRIHDVKMIKDVGKMSLMRRTVNNLFFLLPFYLIGAAISFAIFYGGYSLLKKLNVDEDIHVIIVNLIIFIFFIIIYSIPKKHDRTYKIPKWNKNKQLK